jgi:hypothetical protein
MIYIYICVCVCWLSICICLCIGFIYQKEGGRERERAQEPETNQPPWGNEVKTGKVAMIGDRIASVVDRCWQHFPSDPCGLPKDMVAQAIQRIFAALSHLAWDAPLCVVSWEIAMSLGMGRRLRSYVIMCHDMSYGIPAVFCIFVAGWMEQMSDWGERTLGTTLSVARVQHGATAVCTP